MDSPTGEQTSQTIALSRRAVYILLIAVATANLAGRVFAVRPAPTPTFGSNDRSRWATIRALVEDGTYAIGRRDEQFVTEKNPHGDVGICEEDGWQTIDKVLHPQTKIFYSSKPPLLPTLLAGEYWLLKHGLGIGFTNESTGWAFRIILLSVNVLPLVLYWIALAILAQRLGATDWSRMYLMFAACFATFLTPFTVTLNNHTIASWTGLLSLYATLESLRRTGSGGAWLAALAGFLAGLTACVELPAAALAALLFLILFLFRRKAALAAYLPGALIPFVGLLATNYLALGQFSLAYGEFGSEWYAYPGSHWRMEEGATKSGIDWAWQKESTWSYALHMLIGHHGLFSLTPIFLLSMGGALLGLRNAVGEAPDSAHSRISREQIIVMAATLALTAVVLCFYLFVTPRSTHNYGGWTCGPRQLMWLTPFLLLAMLPCLDRLGDRTWGRWLAVVLLVVSVFSVSNPGWNPWRHPWLYDLMNGIGIISY